MYHTNECFYDGKGIMRNPGEEFYDYHGKMRRPGEYFYDTAGKLRGPKEHFYDKVGKLRAPGEEFYDGSGRMRRGSVKTYANPTLRSSNESFSGAVSSESTGAGGGGGTNGGGGMVLLLGGAAVIGVVCWAILHGTSSGSGSSSGAVYVSGGTPWTDSEISLTAGQSVSIQSSGVIKIAGSDPGKYPDGSTPGVGADSCMGWPGFTAPGLPCFNLIGRIGQGGSPFEIGGASSFRAPASGVLYLGVNDNEFGDNSGAWTVSVRPGT